MQRKYNDKLDAKTKAELEKEIKAFDKQKTLDLIEREAIGGPSVDAYQNWADIHLTWNENKEEMQELPQANPDELSDEDLENHPLSYPSYNTQVSDKQSMFQQQVKNILDECSPREKQVAELLMRNQSFGSIAKILKISKSRVQNCIMEIRKKAGIQ